jgi:hypothetical protein
MHSPRRKDNPNPQGLESIREGAQTALFALGSEFGESTGQAVRAPSPKKSKKTI